MAEPASTSYDDVPYLGLPVDVTHPDCLGAVAALHGLTPTAPDRCRVLELGCADGGNLIAMALSLPEAEFIGIDLSPRQIADGQAIVKTVGVPNVHLRAMSVLDVDETFGMFDYIICHGVYSWVPADVREGILGVCQHRLAPAGVAFVSYNTYPGWRLWTALRDLVQFHASHYHATADRIRQSRAILALTARAVEGSTEVYHQVLRQDLEAVRGQRDAYLYHEYLEDVNEPVYFREFAARAAAHGLQYLDEVRPNPLPSTIPPEVVAALDRMPGGFLDREQYRDLLSGRSFRRTLLCHADLPVRRAVTAEALTGLCFAALAWPAEPPATAETDAVQTFQTADGKSGATDDPLLRSALVHLAEIAPRAEPFADLWQHVAARLGQASGRAPARLAAGPTALAEGLLECYQAGIVEVRFRAPQFPREAGERPVGSPLARLQAATDARVTGLSHRLIELPEFDRAVLRQLDGTRDRAGVLDALAGLVEQGALAMHADGKPLREAAVVRRVLELALPPSLQRLADCGLLLG